MSIVLQSASGVNVAFDRVKFSGNSQVFQSVGASFLDTKMLTQAQSIGRTGTAKSRFALKVPYTYTEGTVVKTDYIHLSVEGTVPATAPLSEVAKAVYMMKTMAALTSTEDLIKSRMFSAT